MNYDFSPEEVKETAEQYFRDGKYYCSEAIVNSIRDHIAPEMSEDCLRMASGFPVGMGKTKCSCGAVTGAILALGYFFGRDEGSTPKDPKSVKTLELSAELNHFFRENNGKNKVTCCSVLTRGMDMASGEHKEQCIYFTGMMAKKLAEIIQREIKEEQHA